MQLADSRPGTGLTSADLPELFCSLSGKVNRAAVLVSRLRVQYKRGFEHRDDGSLGGTVLDSGRLRVLRSWAL